MEGAARDEHRGKPRSNRGVPALALILLACVLVLVARDLPGPCHDTSRLAAADALINQGSLSIDHSRFNYTCDRILVQGHYYSDKPPVLSLLYAGVLALSQAGLGWRWAEDLPEMHQLLVVLTSGLSFLLISAVFLRRAMAAGWPPLIAASFAMLFPAASQLAVFATALNAHIVAAALLLVFWDRVAPTSARPRGLMPGPGLGLILGLAMVIDPLVVTFVLAYLAWWAWGACSAPRGSWRVILVSALPPLLGALLPILVHATLSWTIAGNPLAVNLNPEYFNYPGSQHDAHVLTGVGIKHTDLWALLDYAFDSLLGHHGFFLFNSVTVLGLIALRRGPPGAVWVVGASVVLFFFLTIAFSNNQSGHAYGNRWHVLLVPLLLHAIFTQPWSWVKGLPAIGRIVILLLLFWGGLIALIGLRNPWTPAIEARPSFLVQLSRDPRYVEHELERAKQFLNAGYFHEARGYAELALDHGPSNPGAWLVAVRSASQLGDVARLRGYRERIEESELPEPLRSRLLGHIRQVAGDS